MCNTQLDVGKILTLATFFQSTDACILPMCTLLQDISVGINTFDHVIFTLAFDLILKKINNLQTTICISLRVTKVGGEGTSPAICYNMFNFASMI